MKSVSEIPFFKEIKQAAERWNLDPLMVAAVTKQESAFNPKAVSPVGAKGLMQLMPATDTWLDGDLDEFDVEGNLDNGCRFLDWLRKLLLRKYPALNTPDHENLWKLVWAGYNAGPGTVQKLLTLVLAREGDLGYKYEIWRKYLPDITGEKSKETINYVKKITEYWAEFIQIKDQENKVTTCGSSEISKERLGNMLVMVNSLKKEIDQLLDQACVKK